jgi:Pup amidohydrolase
MKKSVKGSGGARRPKGVRGAARAGVVPKLCGADVELGNFVLGLERAHGTGDLASRALLAEIEGLPRAPERERIEGCGCAFCRGAEARSRRDADFNPQDWGRKFLPSNGGCAYIDLDHLELCVPEVLSAWDHVAAWHAMLRVAQGALDAANARLRPGLRIQALANNSDGRGNSYGSHLNFLVTRRAWEHIFSRKVHYLLLLASFQASSVVYTGQGKVGGENGTPPVDFQIAQRADFFESLTGPQTTYRRPVVNSRDEPLCGPGGGDYARLHSIFFDSTLCHRASLLKVGCTQLLLALVEAEQVSHELILEDPVEAVQRWSRDPSLRARARLIGGEEVTAVELQLLFLEEARRLAAAGALDGVVPRAAEIVELWEDTLAKLAARDFASLARSLDWVLKLSIISEAMRARPRLTWQSPAVKHLDHAYANLDRAEGLYWAYESAGFTERLVSEETVARSVSEPPEDTRAWTRAMLLRSVDASAVEDVNWDRLRFKWEDEGGAVRRRTLHLADPLGHTRETAARAFRRARTLEELLDLLGAVEEEGDGRKLKAARPRESAREAETRAPEPREIVTTLRGLDAGA